MRPCASMTTMPSTAESTIDRHRASLARSSASRRIRSVRSWSMPVNLRSPLIHISPTDRWRGTVVPSRRRGGALLLTPTGVREKPDNDSKESGDDRNQSDGQDGCHKTAWAGRPQSVNGSPSPPGRVGFRDERGEIVDFEGLANDAKSAE